MAYYVNIAEWSPGQVADWIRGWRIRTFQPNFLSLEASYIHLVCGFYFSGLDDSLLPYINSLLNKEINGFRLLTLTVEDMQLLLKIEKIGHQELLMGSIDLLRNFVRRQSQTAVYQSVLMSSYCLMVALQFGPRKSAIFSYAAGMQSQKFIQ